MQCQQKYSDNYQNVIREVAWKNTNKHAMNNHVSSTTSKDGNSILEVSH